MSACGPHEPGVAVLSTGRGSALPFLPTLITASAVAALSLLCRVPSTETPTVPTAQASPAGADGFHPALGASETTLAIPAALAFARLHPLILQIPQLADAEETVREKAPSSRAARPAMATRRPCAGPRCGEPRRVDTAARTTIPPVKAASEPAAVPEPMRGQAEPDEGLLPPGAIPFAATAVSWVETARSFGGSLAGGAATLGSSAVDLLTIAR